MELQQLSWIANFIWGIAHDALPDLYVCENVRSVVLPLLLVRLLDVVLGSTKQPVLYMKASHDRSKNTKGCWRKSSVRLPNE